MLQIKEFTGYMKYFEDLGEPIDFDGLDIKPRYFSAKEQLNAFLTNNSKVEYIDLKIEPNQDKLYLVYKTN